MIDGSELVTLVLTKHEVINLRGLQAAHLRQLGGGVDPRNPVEVRPSVESLFEEGVELYDKLGRAQFGEKYPHWS